MKGLRNLIRDLADRSRMRPGVHNRLVHWAHAPEFRRWCQNHSCECLPDRISLYQFILEREGLAGPIDYLEFGVARGASIRWWVEHNPHPDSKFVGFDTFEGLPADWESFPTGAFSAGGEAPAIADARCSFVKGLFQDTLPGWLTGRELTHRVVLNIDADLYGSTLLALTQLLPRLKSGDIIIFDEFNNYLHEYRAFIDATTAHARSFTAIARDGEFAHVAFKLT